MLKIVFNLLEFSPSQTMCPCLHCYLSFSPINDNLIEVMLITYSLKNNQYLELNFSHISYIKWGLTGCVRLIIFLVQLMKELDI